MKVSVNLLTSGSAALIGKLRLTGSFLKFLSIWKVSTFRGARLPVPDCDRGQLMKYNRHQLHHMVSFVLLTVLFIGAGCKSSSYQNAAQPVSAAKSIPTPSRRLIKEEGWKIPGLAVAKEVRPPSLLQAASSDRVKVYSSWLGPLSRAAAPITLRDYLSEQELKELGITAKKLHVLTIVKYDLGDRPFCYAVKYRAKYTIDALHYYDEDGDKNFELVETGTASTEFIPRIPNVTKQ
jgi:hypothetical protein